MSKVNPFLNPAHMNAASQAAVPRVKAQTKPPVDFSSPAHNPFQSLSSSSQKGSADYFVPVFAEGRSGSFLA